MKRREFLQATAALGAGALLDIHTVGANRPSYCEIRPACAWS
jgi:hypothetical protein